jgi:hypothetical protein
MLCMPPLRRRAGDLQHVGADETIDGRRDMGGSGARPIVAHTPERPVTLARSSPDAFWRADAGQFSRASKGISLIRDHPTYGRHERVRVRRDHGVHFSST